jgi:hypothetical protein
VAKLDFNAWEHHVLSSVELDPDAAAAALLIAAEYLRAAKPLPRDLADHLAGAIETSMRKPQSKRGAALLLELKLTALNQRPLASWIEVGMEVDRVIAESGMSKSAAEMQVASDREIGRSTVQNYYRAYLKALADTPSE